MADSRFWHILFILLSTLKLISCTKGAIGSVNDDQLHQMIKERKNVMVLFCNEDIGPECMHKTTEINRALENSLNSDITAVVALGSVIPKKYGLKSLPQLMLYREQRPLLYHASHDPEGELGDWLDRNVQLATKQLNEDSFEHDTQAGTGATTGDWFVMFFDQDDCPELLPNWEALAVWLKQKLNVATVDVAANPMLTERFHINKCPTLILFHHGSMYTYALNLKDVESLTSFAEGWYKNVPGVKVPVDPTPFDKLTDDIAVYLKSLDQKLLLAATVGGFVILSTLVLCCICRTKDDKGKEKEE